MTYTLHLGDCLDIMPTFDACSIDAIVCDPPYGLSFMGKNWDHGIPGVPFWTEALRVAKPGAHLLAFGGTRTFHRLAVAIEDAGWEIRDTVCWLYGSGFPKSHDVSKAIDREAWAEREVVGRYSDNNRKVAKHQNTHATWDGAAMVSITAPATPDAARWAGWGTALKPAWEPIIVARKPFACTVAQNVLTWGTGAINVDGCRVEITDGATMARNNGDSLSWGGTYGKGANSAALHGEPSGRWPANVVHDGSAEVLQGFPVSSSPTRVTTGGKSTFQATGKAQRVIDCYGDTGSASRFFYCAKASKADRDEGLEGWEERAIGHNLSTNACARCGKRVKHNGSGEGCECGDLRETVKLPAASRNHHPTVKPTSLMRWIVTLVTPPGGTVLDPFMGSGSTGKAAALLGFDFVGIEQDPEYIAIAAARIAHAANQVKQPELLR